MKFKNGQKVLNILPFGPDGNKDSLPKFSTGIIQEFSEDPSPYIFVNFEYKIYFPIVESTYYLESKFLVPNTKFFRKLYGVEG